MAKKKKEQLQYGQMPIPQGQKEYSRLKLDWSGLNRRQVIDTGVLSMESNISTAEAPYLVPSQKRKDIIGETWTGKAYEHPISMFGFDGFLVAIYRDDNVLKLDYIVLTKSGEIQDIHTGIIKSGVGRDTDSVQRSMVQFNVYENSTDVLDGVYVKKLLLFPDKVSMFMKIETVSSTDEMTDTGVMYCYPKSSGEKRYYQYDNAYKEFVYTGSVMNSECFVLDSLDVVVKEFYNDGYQKAESGSYFDDGYKLTEAKRFNDGYRKTNYEKFYDGYVKVTSGKYNEENGQIYFQRSGQYSPYTYTVAMLNDGDSLKGLYQRAITSIGTLSNTTFYERIGDAHPYTYEKVADLEYDADVSDYYEKMSDTQYSLTQEPFYEREWNEETESYTYSKVEDVLNSDTDISDYYEKISDKDIEPTVYYKRSGSEKPYTYTAVKDLDYGDNVSKYYIYTNNFAPPDDSDKSCYWKNSCNNLVYCYSTDKGTEYDEADAKEITRDPSKQEGAGELDTSTLYKYDNKYYYYNVDIGKWVEYTDDTKKEKGFALSIPPAFPNLKYAAVHLSRLFGVDDDRVHVSGFNDYSNWNLDTVTESNESNAWSSAAQSNTKANGEFTGIAVYDNHVVCFKHDFMHEIYNNKNPFRLVDIYAEGCIDNRSIQEVDGRLIFVSADEVKIYTGSNPRAIGYNLGIDCFTYAVSGSDGRNYYLYCEDKNEKGYLFVYDTFVGQWSQQAIDEGVWVLNFAHNKNGMYAFFSNGLIYKMDTGKYNHDWSFETDMSTALTASSSSSYPTVSIKHLTKLQMLAYVDEKSSFKVYALYDNEEFNADTSHLLYDSAGKTGLFPIRLKPRMTANYGFKLHFEGTGYVRLYGMELRVSAGGELFV